MSSILTNSSSMVALQTLKGINRDMAKVQDEISTGLKVATAKDNSSSWSIASTMNSDVASYKKLGESLTSASALVGVARTAAEQVGDLVKQIQTKVVQAQNPDADVTKLTADVTALAATITSIAASAQYNGINLVNTGSTAETITVRPRESVSTRIVAFLGRSPLHIALVVLAGLWLLPTVGLLVTSFRPRPDIASTGWWTAFTSTDFTLKNYDLVLNGQEIGGGSVRIHSRALQQCVLAHILELTPSEQARFSHLLHALDCGAPPHAGIALGFDRLMAILCRTESIRDVIAFPKQGSGIDPLFRSPAPLTAPDQNNHPTHSLLRLYGLSKS